MIFTVKNFLKNKILWSIIILVAVLFVIYSVLCFVTAGNLGFPIQLQRTVSFNQSEIYSDLEDFRIEGNVIYSLSENGAINLHLKDGSYGKFRFVTIFTSRLSDIRAKTDIRYRKGNGGFAEDNIGKFRLTEGRNEVHISYGDWSDIRLHLGIRKDISMIVDRVVLSRLPILPGYFLPLCLVLCLTACVLWFFVVFCGLGKWLKAHPAVLLMGIILLQILTMCYYVNQKRGYHVDEFSSHVQANGQLTGGYPRQDANFFNQWNTSDYFKNFLTVQSEERFEFKTVYLFFAKHGATHPPFYHMQLHAVFSLFPNKFSNWFAAVINIFWLTAANIMLYMASKKLLKSNLLALLPCAVWGLSTGAISNAVFFRMYATLTFFFTTLTYLGVLLISGKRKADISFCISLASVIFFGAFTQYYFFIFFSFSAIGLGFYLLYEKKYKRIRNCIITVCVSFGLYLICWPYAIHGLLSSSRGKQSVVNLLNSGDFLNSVNSYIKILDKQLFEGQLFIITIFFLLLIIVYMIKFIIHNRNSKSIGVVKTDLFLNIFILFNSIMYFLIVAKISPYKSDRYIFAVYPTVILLFIALLYQILRYIINKETAFIILTFVSVFLVFQPKHANHLYANHIDVTLILKEYKTSSCIVMSQNSSIERQILDFTQFDRTFICRVPEDFDIAADGITPGQNLFLYISQDLEQDAILNTVHKKLQYKDATLLYESYGYYAYRIDW